MYDFSVVQPTLILPISTGAGGRMHGIASVVYPNPPY